MWNDKNHPVPKRGDTVRLNWHGIDMIFGSSTGLGHMRTKKMKIAWISDFSMTDDVDTYLVHVDDPEINQFFLDHRMFDIVGE